MSTDVVLHSSVIRNPLTRVARQSIVRDFDRQRVRVTAVTDQPRITVLVSAEQRRRLWGTASVTAEQRAAVLAAFRGVTDSPVTWHHEEES